MQDIRIYFAQRGVHAVVAPHFLAEGTSSQQHGRLSLWHTPSFITSLYESLRRCRSFAAVRLEPPRFTQSAAPTCAWDRSTSSFMFIITLTHQCVHFADSVQYKRFRSQSSNLSGWGSLIDSRFQRSFTVRPKLHLVHISNKALSKHAVVVG